jgi:hypothetical protein
VSEPNKIRTVPDLHEAIAKAKTPKHRKDIHARAAYLGLLSKLPKHWRADGTIMEEE